MAKGAKPEIRVPVWDTCETPGSRFRLQARHLQDDLPGTAVAAVRSVCSQAFSERKQTCLQPATGTVRVIMIRALTGGGTGHQRKRRRLSR